MSDYLENQLKDRFNLVKLWTYSSKTDFLKHNSHSIRAVVGNTKIGADAELIDSLPELEIVSSYSVGLDKIDLRKCQEKGIRVTNTPDVLTDDVADVAMGLMLAVARRVCECDRFVRRGLWPKGDFRLTNKVLKLLLFMYSFLILIFFYYGFSFNEQLAMNNEIEFCVI